MPGLEHVIRLFTVIFVAAALLTPVVPWPVFAQSPTNDPLSVRASVDNVQPYLGQQLTYVFKIYQSSGLTPSSGEVRYEPPSFAGFWNNQPVEQDEYTETIDSNEYRVRELRTTLFPSVVGTVVIGPAALTVSTGTAQSQELSKSTPLHLQVRPLPAGAPEEFAGAVGRFDITAEVDADTGQVNEPVQLTVTVSGEGNIEALPDPAWPEFTGWRVIESPADTYSQVVAGQVTGRRTIGITLVPETAGEQTIPEIGYPHFDPDSEKYVSMATVPIVVSVADTDEIPEAPRIPDVDRAAAEEGSEMRSIKAVPMSLRKSSGDLTGNKAYWAAWAIPPLAIAAAVVWRRRRASLEASRADSLRLNALPSARTALTRAVTSGVDPRIASADSVSSYLSAQFEAPVGGLTREALLGRLHESGVSPDLERRVEDILAVGEAARYTPPASGSVGAGDHADRASQLLVELDEAINA